MFSLRPQSTRFISRNRFIWHAAVRIVWLCDAKMLSCTPLCTRPRPCLYSAHVLYRHIHGSLSKTWSSMAGGHCHIVRVAVEKQMSLSKCMFAAANAALQLGGDNLSRQADFCSRQVFFVFSPQWQNQICINRLPLVFGAAKLVKIYHCKRDLWHISCKSSYFLQLVMFVAAKNNNNNPKTEEKKQQQQQTNDDAGLSMQSWFCKCKTSPLLLLLFIPIHLQK